MNELRLLSEGFKQRILLLPVEEIDKRYLCVRINIDEGTDSTGNSYRCQFEVRKKSKVVCLPKIADDLYTKIGWYWYKDNMPNNALAPDAKGRRENPVIFLTAWLRRCSKPVK